MSQDTRYTQEQHETDVIVGANLRRLRTLRGLSLQALGDAAGITFQQVQKYENATNRLSASRIKQLADILQCRIEDFFEGVDTGTDIKPVAPISKTLMRHAEILDAIPDNIRKPLTNYIKELSAALAEGNNP